MSLVDGLLTHVCDILEPSMVRDDRGTFGNTGLQPVASKVFCLVNQASQSLIDAFGGKQLNISHVIYFDISARDLIVTNQVITNVAPFGTTDYERDNFGDAGILPTQYRVIQSTVPNLEPDHLEVAVQQMQGRKAVPN